MRGTVLVIAVILSGCGSVDTDAEVKLIGGQVASIPQMVRLNIGCSATIVGPRTVLTAGHCASTGKTVSYSYRGKSYSAKITRNPSYTSFWPKAGNDHSLGVTSENMPGPYAVIDRAAVQVGEELMLSGYGCTQNGGSDKPDGQLRIGMSQVSRMTSIEIVTQGGAALCYGDSGGSIIRRDNNVLRVVGVNSKGNIVAGGNSWFARVDISSFKKLVDKVGHIVCGVNKNC